MAGAGYKLFNTGDVLTAAQVNTYLQEQVIMVFNDATARTTALSGVLAEGMVSYLKSTKVVEIYNGTAWASLDDPNAIQNTIVDAKGDLIAATANDTPARLAVGNNGETLVADSSTSTGLRWQGNFAAGKNVFLNGDLRINQRAFSSTGSNGVYTFDRWITSCSGGTTTFTAQTFTAGTAPVAGYEGINYLRIAVSGQGVGHFCAINQRIEDVRTLAGTTVTVSWWARATSGTPKMFVIARQQFGSGGSAAADASISQVTLSTSWTRFTGTMTIPSVSGKTIGTGSNLEVFFLVSDGNGSMGAQNNTFELWGFQIEQGSVATAFQTATGTLAGELAACARYFPVISVQEATGYGYATNSGIYTIPFLTEARVAPTGMTLISGTAQAYGRNTAYNVTPVFNAGSVSMANIVATTGLTLTAGEGSRIGNNFRIGFTGCEL